MPFRIAVDQRDPRTSCPKCHGGVLEIVPGYRSRAHLVAKCLRCHAGVALPSKFIGRCVLYSDLNHNELIEESEVAGLIGPRCQNCQFYNPETMNPRLNPVLLKRCPKLDLTYKPDITEIETFFRRFRDIDPVEDKDDALKRLIQGHKDWPRIS